MRVGRAFGAGRWQRPLAPFDPGCIFTRNMEAALVDADQKYAHRLGNQLNYANTAYSYDGKAAPSFFGYEGYGYDGFPVGFSTTINRSEFTPSLFIVGPNEPTKQVLYVNSKKEAQPAGAAQNLQSKFNAVPVPDVTKCPSGKLVAGGSDKEICIYRPSTDEMWEAWKFEAIEGQYMFQYGGYIPEVSKANGIFLTSGEGAWGARACGLYLIGGLLTMQDMIEVLRGGAIKHALGISISVTGPAERAPATRFDSSSHTPKFLENGSTPNPAFGTVDQVPEGAWFRFPPGSKASSYGITTPLATAVFDAVRTYGLFINDGSSVAAFYLESAVSLGSPYSFAKVNPLPGQAFTSFVPTSWEDPTLPAFTESLTGPTSVWAKQPWKELELIKPFAS